MATTAAKIGRNDPCWCGSGVEFKKCHLDQEKQPTPRVWEVDASLRSEHEHGTCMHVGGTAGEVCAKPAIGSHTVPRKMLKQIARDGHVYHHSATIRDIEKAHGKPALEPIGVNRASTLPIFCSHHDSESFAALERRSFTGSAEQCFLLAYRAVCLEFRKKCDQLKNVDLIRGLDTGRPISEQIAIQAEIAVYAEAVRVSVRDMEHHKREFDSALFSRDFSKVRAYIVNLDRVPELLCAGALYPECDFDGCAIGNLSNLDRTPELVTFSLISADTGGAFVFTWLEGSDNPCRQLAASLDRLRDDELPQALARFIFEFCENHYLNPDWWDKADGNIKTALMDRFAKAASLYEPRAPESCLASDGVFAVSWTVTGRSWV